MLGCTCLKDTTSPSSEGAKVWSKRKFTGIFFTNPFQKAEYLGVSFYSLFAIAHQQ